MWFSVSCRGCVLAFAESIEVTIKSIDMDNQRMEAISSVNNIRTKLDEIGMNVFTVELETCVVTEQGTEFHVVTVSNVLSFSCICLKCGQGFMTKSPLESHMKTHWQGEGHREGQVEGRDIPGNLSPGVFPDRNMASVAGNSAYKDPISNTDRDEFEDRNADASGQENYNLDRNAASGADESELVDGSVALIETPIHVKSLKNDEEPMTSPQKKLFWDGIKNEDTEKCIDSQRLHVNNSVNNEKLSEEKQLPSLQSKVKPAKRPAKKRPVLSRIRRSNRWSTKKKTQVSQKITFSVRKTNRNMQTETWKPSDASVVQKIKGEECEGQNLTTKWKQRSRKIIKTLECNMCGKKGFRLRQTLMDHMNVHTGDKPHACELCGRKYSSRYKLSIHYKRHTTSKHNCAVCGKHFLKISDMRNHARVHTGEKPHLCSVCGRQFRVAGQVTEHMKVHIGEKTHVCSTCGKAFTRAAYLARHFRMHTDVCYVCSLCGRSFKYATGMNNHMRNEHGDQQTMTCGICGKVLKGKNSFNEHRKRHNMEKTHVCSECGKVFRVKSDLTAHKRVHIEGKRFACPHCGKSFCQKFYYEEHLRIHTGEKPLDCEQCGERFRMRAALRKHMKTRHQETRPTQSQQPEREGHAQFENDNCPDLNI